MEKIKPPVWFWVVAVIMLVWNLAGVGSFFQYAMVSDEALAAMSPEEQELFNAVPIWATAAFAIAVFGSSIGCIGLLMRKSWSRLVLIISFVGIIVQMTYNIFISKNMEVYGPGSVAMPIMIIVIGAFLIWFAGFAIKKNWLA